MEVQAVVGREALCPQRKKTDSKKLKMQTVSKGFSVPQQHMEASSKPLFKMI